MAQTLTCPFPSDINTLSNVGFQFNITKIPEITYFCQTADLPEMSLGDASQKTSLVDLPLPGDKIQYSPLKIDFLVDSTMTNYKAVHNWMVGLGFPESHEQFTKLQNDNTLDNSFEYSDGTLTILNSSNTSTATVSFIDLFPVSLNTITFSAKETDIIYVVGSATFLYSYYHFN